MEKIEAISPVLPLNKMKIEVEVLGILKNYVSRKMRKETSSVILEDSISLCNLIKLILIPYDVEKIVLVNGKYVPPNYMLQDGDIVKIFSPIPGG